MAQNRGYTPNELVRLMPRRGPVQMKFGPNILRSIENGETDGHELIDAIEKKGIQVAAETKREVGRNDPCPCGSGKKYKNCCGRLN